VCSIIEAIIRYRDGWTDLVEFLCVGEYPMTEAQAAEKEVPGSRADTLHCGRNVALAFTMQVSPL